MVYESHMTEYNIVRDASFHQSSPRFVCKNWALHLRLSEQQGFQSKCRNPRCSLSCYQNYRAKQGHVLVRLVTRHLPENVTCYRGCLKLHDHATKEDHSKIVSKFMKSMNRHARRRDATIQVHLTAHITSPSDMHYDLLAYSDLPKTTFREVLKSSWKNVGGKSAAVPELDTEQEKIKAAKYAAKDEANATKKEFRYLPKSGTHLTRYTAGFFNGQSVESLWHELVAEWFAEAETEFAVEYMISKFCGTSTPPKTASDADLEALEDAYKISTNSINRKTIELAQTYYTQLTPTTPETALDKYDLSTRLSIPTTLFTALMKTDDRVKFTEDNRIYRTPLAEVTPTPPPGGVASCEARLQEERGVHHALAA
jgi:hypothetical protein